MKIMEAKLGVTTCDKCQQPMKKGQPVLIIAEGDITKSDNALTFNGSCVRYACHLNCWNGFEEKMDSEHLVDAFQEEKYTNIPKENLIVFSVYSVSKSGEPCSFERLIKECFTLFPTAFGFSRYRQWPDSLKFDRPLRTLRKRGWIVGGPKTLFSVTKFGEAIAKETEQLLRGPRLAKKHARKSLRGVDTALINSLKENPAYIKFLENKKQFSLTEMELRALLQCTLETPLRVLKQNLQYSKNLAVEYNDNELLDFLQACEQSVIGKEG